MMYVCVLITYFCILHLSHLKNSTCQCLFKVSVLRWQSDSGPNTDWNFSQSHRLTLFTSVVIMPDEKIPCRFILERTVKLCERNPKWIGVRGAHFCPLTAKQRGVFVISGTFLLVKTSGFALIPCWPLLAAVSQHKWNFLWSETLIVELWCLV